MFDTHFSKQAKTARILNNHFCSKSKKMEETSGTPLYREQLVEDSATGAVTNQSLVIPVIEEKLKIEKKVIESGKVRISKKVREDEEVVDIPVLQEEVQVERIPVHRFVDTAPQVRYEGDTMIVPVVREVVVVEKRIELIEELHITKRISQTQATQHVTLRKEEVTVERLPGENLNPSGS